MAQNPELVVAPGQGSPGPAPFPVERKGPERSSCLTPSLQGISRGDLSQPQPQPTCWDLLQSQYCSWSCRGLDQGVTLKDADRGTGLSEGSGGGTESPFRAGEVESGAHTLPSGSLPSPCFMFLHSTTHHVICYIFYSCISL